MFRLFSFDESSAQISKNLEEEISILLKNSYFGRITKEQLGNLNMNENINCEWQNDYKLNPEDYFWLIIKNEVIGVVDIHPQIKVGEYKYIWIDTMCTFSSTNSIIATSGRLLWAYILKVINLKYKKFIIYNRAIEESKKYHIKMGMRPYKDIGLSYEIISNLPEIREDEGKDDYLNNTANDHQTSFLFYKSNKYINYSSIFDILMTLNNYNFDKYKKKYHKYKKKYLRLKSIAQNNYL